MSLVASGEGAAAAATSPPDAVTLSASGPYPLTEFATLVPGGAPGCTEVSTRPSQAGTFAPLISVYPNASACKAGGVPAIQAVALNRATLELSENRSFPSYAELNSWVSGLQNDVLVLVQVDGSFSGTVPFDAENFNAAATKLGAQGFAPPANTDLVVAGVPGWPAGAGYQNGSTEYPTGYPVNGFLVRDKNNNYSILPGGYTAYDTAVSGSPGTMEIAGRRYSMGPCEDPARSSYGCSAQDPYFHIVAVNAADPSIVVAEHAYGVDTAVCDAGGQCVGELEQYRMATDLVSYVGDPSRLVFVQSVGQPYNYSSDESATPNRLVVHGWRPARAPGRHRARLQYGTDTPRRPSKRLRACRWPGFGGRGPVRTR